MSGRGRGILPRRVGLRADIKECMRAYKVYQVRVSVREGRVTQCKV